LLAYHLNGDVLMGNDAKPNLYLPVNLLRHGRLSFKPDEMPFMFAWRMRTPNGDVYSDRLDDLRQSIGGRAGASLLAEGALAVDRAKYYVVPSVRRGHYINSYGPGAGLTALPLFAAMAVWRSGSLEDASWLWYGGKAVASLFVAGSAVFVFLTALSFGAPRRAMLISVAYGLGTCVWSTSSQGLWQHAPNEFFLALGTYYLTRLDRQRHAALLSGAGYSAALACRPTSAVALVAAGGYLLLVHRKRLGGFALGALPITFLLALYNATFLGAPWRFGQTTMDRPDLWPTPLWLGGAGLLASPSRGLLVFSPFLVFALWGMVRAWREPEYLPIRPVTLAVLGIWCLQAKWYSWWGGWSYGYRPIVDTAPLLAVMLIPVIETIVRRAVLLALFLILLAWSVLVQWLGAFAYDLDGWNARPVAYEMELPRRSRTITVPTRDEARRLKQRAGARLVQTITLDIDQPQNRHRLWSVRDNMILHYLTHYREARERKRIRTAQYLAHPSY
jgi:hypothetical protein